MYEEGQLYSPVTTDEHGGVTVHLAHDHPGANDPAYRARRGEIAAAALSWRPGEPPPEIAYSEEEQAVWRAVSRELERKHRRYAVSEYLDAKARVGMPVDRIPSLEEVSDLIEPISGWRYLPAAGLVPLAQFYRSLADRRFYSTQYVRHSDVPLYTPEPDIIHEVIGHGHMLAAPTFGELHWLAGEAARRLHDEESLKFLSRVFWFSLEFGTVIEDGELRAYGAGILSSYGEIEEFRGMDHRRLDLAEMGTSDYDITAYQPVLYRADSIQELIEVVGGFFRDCTDETVTELRSRGATKAGVR